MILLRHGQSEFNLHFTATRRDPGIADARLTELGHAQAADAARRLRPERVRRIIVSPYTRALQTAAPIAESLGLPVIVNPIVRERCAFACDVGTPRTELALAWSELDFSHIDEIWWPAMPEPATAVVARAALFRAEMSALPDWSDTLVVTHWGFLMALTGQSVQNGTLLRFDPTASPPAEIPWRP
ncbi:MAG: histidine phosphatase family protein [Pseudomonadota bacterium]|nr:histidine phosphatase family protein [Pseudomonadota bacterium]